MDKTLLVYDGDCPFCSKYAELVRFKKAAGEVQIINAREHPEVVKEFSDRGYDLDKGMGLKMDGRYYHGADALNHIALMSTGSGLFNSFTAAVFKSKIASAILYPVLKAARRAALIMKGKKGIGA